MLEMSDGYYSFENVKDVIKNDFLKERELCDFIELNIEKFVSDLGFSYLTHHREYTLTQSRNLKGNSKLDFLVETICGQRIALECKNPYYAIELSLAVGQCLRYLMEFEVNKNPLDKIYIVSSKMDHRVPLIIQRFNLPIEFVVMDKKKHLIFKKAG